MGRKNYKIAFIVNNFPSVSETFILNQIVDLIERGFDVTIYSLNRRKVSLLHQAIDRYKLIEKTTYYKHPFSSGLHGLLRFVFFFLKNSITLSRVLGLGLFNSKKLRKAIYNESLSKSVAEFINRSDADIVHAHFGSLGMLVANLIDKGQLRQFMFVTSFHGHDLNPAYIDRYKKEYKNLFRFGHALTVNSRYLQEILLQVYPTQKNVFVLPVGLQTEKYRRTLDEGNKPITICTVLFCGRFVEFKAPDLAVQIIHTLVKRGINNVRLRMIGEGKLKNSVEHLIEKLSLRSIVTLLGPQSQEQVIDEMNRADIFLLPGIHEKETGRAETQGLVIQEAQAMELPVVVSDAGGIKYGVLDDISGFVVKQGDIEGFADKIELLINSRPLRATMAKAGRDFVVRTFDSKILGDKLLQIYDGIYNT